MENRFEHLPPEEKQGWGAYATPPSLPGQQHNSPVYQSQQASPLCARVRDALPALLENEGEINPPMASALYGHLSVCPGCAREFDEMQRVIHLVESLGPAELPMDFSAMILRRIQGLPTPADLAHKDAVTRPFAPASSASSVNGLPANTEVPRRKLADGGQSAQTAMPRQKTSLNVGTTLLEEQDLLLRAGTHLWERLTLAGLLSVGMTLFLMTQWGGQMMGANLNLVLAWLGQVGETLRRVPLLGALFAVMLSALAQVGDLLGDTYRTMGGLAAHGLALDIALCAGVYYLFLRRQRGQMRRI